MEICKCLLSISVPASQFLYLTHVKNSYWISAYVDFFLCFWQSFWLCPLGLGIVTARPLLALYSHSICCAFPKTYLHICNNYVNKMNPCHLNLVWLGHLFPIADCDWLIVNVLAWMRRWLVDFEWQKYCSYKGW